MLPMPHPRQARELMEDAAGRLGSRAIVIASNVNGKNRDDSEVLPLLEATMGLSIVVHPVYQGKLGR